LLIRATHLPGIAGTWRLFLNNRATIFVLHRFHDEELGIPGHDPATLRRLLAFLRRERFEILSLRELFRRLEYPDEPLHGAVAITLDDGYIDQATIAAPIFAEFDCPATIFVTTGFLDGRLWQWWDKIDFIFRRTRAREIVLELREESLRYAWYDDAGLQRARDDFTERCKVVDDLEKHALILSLAHLAEVDLPDETPPEYAPMSWDQLRRCETQGISFGPHSVTHPILARVTAERSRWEITESWERLRAEAHDPVPFFSYPNGLPPDFGEREIATVRELGFEGGLSSSGGHIMVPLCSEDARFRIPRFGFPAGHSQPLQYASGFERLKQIVRREVNR
jgi:peptidoglycan/xylan/chitin deacetylase (PgdA/CDA1 family)